METSPNISKGGKDVNQSECQIPGEEELDDALCNKDPNANWGTEPNFNLNLNLTSSRNPCPVTETSKRHGGTKKDEGNKGSGKSAVKVAVIKETGKWATTVKTTLMSQGEKDDPSRQKSKIPALSRSPTAERPVNSRGEQRLKSPNPKHTPTLSPKTHTHSSMAASPKPNRLGQTTTASSLTTAEGLKTQRAEPASILNRKPQTNDMTAKSINKVMSQKIQSGRKEDGGRESILKTQSPQTRHAPVNPNVHSQKGDTKITSPKPTNQTPTLTGKTLKPDLGSTTVKSNEQASRDTGTHNSAMSSISPKLQNQRVEKALLSTKTLQQSSLSPNSSTQRKVTGTRSSDRLDTKENLGSNDSSSGCLLKTSSKSSTNSKATTVTTDSLDSQSGNHLKVSPHSNTTSGSKDSLDSKSGSTSKTSLGSKDSLDSKTGSNSKASSDSKTGMGSRDSLDSKTTTENKGNKSGLDSKTAMVSKSGLGSKDDPSKTQSPSASFNPRCIPNIKLVSESNFSSGSDVLSNSKPGLVQLTSTPALVATGPKKNHDVSVFSTSSGHNDNNLTGSTPGSASRSPGPGKSLGSIPSGPSREVLKSPGSAPGNYLYTFKGSKPPKLTFADLLIFS